MQRTDRSDGWGKVTSYDALATMPEPIRRWADKKGLRSLVERYGWSFCDVCGQIGIRWNTDEFPEGINLEFTTQYHGWIHPPADGMKGGYATDFANHWGLEEEPEKLDARDLSYYFDLFMRSLNNSWRLESNPETRHKPGVTNPWDFCFSGKVSFGTRKGGGRGLCPKCGRPGTGEGVVKGERRFFHGPNDTCYLGMDNPKRIKRPEATCPKCGELGRESISKGKYRYFRHKSKTCYVGKVLTNPPYSKVEPSEGNTTPGSNETTMLIGEPSENHESDSVRTE